MAIAAVGQICSSASMTHNLEQCVRLVSKAAAAGAKVLFLPEASDYIATSAAESLSLAKPVATSPFVTGLQSAAARHSVAVHVGIHVPVAVQALGPSAVSSPVLTSAPSSGGGDGATTKLYNRTIYIQEDGHIKEDASYDKLHLFDYASLRESASAQAGPSFTPPFASPVGRVGSLICFDLRFPEAALALTKGAKFRDAPAQVLTYPSAFTVPTGRAHWEVLLRARAVETQSWVVAAAQVGRHHGPGGRRVSYGRSMVVDPWGKVCAELKGVVGETDDAWEAEDGAVGQLGIVDIDLEQLASVRERMPLIRRTDVYPEI
ncbi:putative secondary metabolism biosynthetic enzyme [Pestalotiopsis sp. IQ-011]